MAFKSRIIYRDAGKGKGSQQGLGGPWVGASGRYCSSEEQRERDKGVGVSPAPREQRLKQNVPHQELRWREKDLGRKSRGTRTLPTHLLQGLPLGQIQLAVWWARQPSDAAGSGLPLGTKKDGKRGESGKMSREGQMARTSVQGPRGLSVSGHLEWGFLEMLCLVGLPHSRV